MYYRNSSISEIYIFEQNPILFTLRESRLYPIAFGMTPSASVLSKARSRRLRLRPRCLGSVASSIFAQLGFMESLFRNIRHGGVNTLVIFKLIFFLIVFDDVVIRH